MGQWEVQELPKPQNLQFGNAGSNWMSTSNSVGPMICTTCLRHLKVSRCLLWYCKLCPVAHKTPPCPPTTAHLLFGGFCGLPLMRELSTHLIHPCLSFQQLHPGRLNARLLSCRKLPQLRHLTVCLPQPALNCLICSRAVMELGVVSN